MKWIVSLAAVFIVAGCAGSNRQTYNVVVHNKCELPVMVWLTKDGPPAEKGWYTPEQFAGTAPDTPSPGVQLPAGKTADTGKVSGAFPAGTNAILLVFRSGASADRPGGSEPVTVKLQPGKNELSVTTDPSGRLVAEPSK
jgi:hypothetical protein